jgi:hypothetical protein
MSKGTLERSGFSRGVDIGVPEFEARLDHTTGHNPRSYAEHSEVYLDGVFGYLILVIAPNMLT